jgi:hypothetical protein
LLLTIALIVSACSRDDAPSAGPTPTPGAAATPSYLLEGRFINEKGSKTIGFVINYRFNCFGLFERRLAEHSGSDAHAGGAATATPVPTTAPDLGPGFHPEAPTA